MKKIINLFAILAIVGMVFTGCQKDENLLKNEEVHLSGASNEMAVINGRTFKFEHKMKPKGEKGLAADESVWLKTKTAYTLGSNEQYKTIKVYRQSDPDKYFYIMIENLRYNPNNNGSWVYGNNPSNVSVYGRLYDWNTAYNLRNRIYMPLPKRKGNRVRIINRFGQLPTIQDINDLLETSHVGHLPSNGTDIFGDENTWDYYFDAFVAGLDETNNIADAYHTLSGWRDNLDVVPNNTEFNDINKEVKFWLRNRAGNDNNFHYPLSIDSYCADHLIVAYINVACANRFGYAVRYVFYPWQ